MAGRLSRGWSMARASYGVLKQHPNLAVFPVISGAILLTVSAAILASLMPEFGPIHRATKSVWDSLGDGQSGNVLFYVLAFCVLYVLTAISIFLNVAMIHAALRAHAGEQPTVRDGLTAAMGLLPQILGWALVATTVGIVLNVIRDYLKNYLGFLGSLLGGVLELSWTVVTYFVLPVLASERLGPIAALKRSAAILRSKWGESLSGEARIGLLGVLFFLVATAVFMLGLAITLSGGIGMASLGSLLMGLGVIGGVVCIVVFSALSTIFQSGVYLYATTGRVPPSLDVDLLQGAFQRKK